MKAKRKPKFDIGQVVAWCGMSDKPLAYYRIVSFFYDDQDQIRYTFQIEFGQLSNSLCPIESMLRPLTARERGRK